MNIKINGRSIESDSPIASGKSNSKTKYVFVRLYDSKYKGFRPGATFLKIGQKIVKDKSWKVFSSHAAINTNLTDKFYGLSISGNSYLKPESCEGKIPGTWINDKDFDLKESKFYVYSFKCKPDEYASCKNSIAHTLNSGNVYFDALFTVARISFYSIIRKIKQIFSNESYGNIKHNKLNDHAIDNKTIRDVCSTYVASVLCQNIASIRKWFVENHKNTKLISPSDIPNIKGAHFCFSGTFDKYTDCAKKYVNKHEEYKPYL